MQQPNPQIPERMTAKVFNLAARLYAEQNAAYSLAELQQAGIEAQIPAELIEQAWRDIQIQQAQAQARRKTAVVIALSASVAIAFWSGWSYNIFTRSAQKVEIAWSQVENQFQRRADLIPALVELTRSPTLANSASTQTLIQARQLYLQAQTPTEKVAASQQMSQAIERFQAELAQTSTQKTDPALQDLRYELIGTENRIAVERRRYNQAVQSYNHQIQQFPNVLLAPLLGFSPKPYLSSTKNPLLPQ
ncbi:MAG TPA: LemA family protein [Candidatus Obscuribacterales bacterium]